MMDQSAFVAVPEDRRPEALERLLAVNGVGDQSHVQRFLDFAQSNQIRLDFMWSIVNDSDRFLHTVLVVPSPGRTAMFFASHPTHEDETKTIGSLLRHAAASLSPDEIHLAQALLDPCEQLDQRTYHAGGFVELARLSYMERAVPRSRRNGPVQWPSDVTIEPYRESLEQDLITILEASYENTLDCPALRGLRDTSDILRGHESSGVFDADLWTILRIEGEPAGALLLNPSPQQRSVELVYLGLAVKARGRGLGRMLLRHGLWRIAGRTERTMTLAVDERNAPAVALYRAEHFRCVLRRVAMIRPLREDANSCADLFAKKFSTND